MSTPSPPLSDAGTRVCIACGKTYAKPYVTGAKRWARRKYCSPKCSQRPRETLGQCFMRQRGPQLSNGCIEWAGHIDVNGYGHFSWSGRPHKAHRVAYATLVGPIPTGLCICHVCDNRICTNPAHLFLGTSAENVTDMVTKRRHRYGESHPRARLTASDVLAIRGSVELTRVLSARFSVTKRTIWDIKHRRSWRHVE